jgi:hypothetical protein
MTEVSPSQNEFLAWMSELSNWGRWGADDQRGTLNLITPRKDGRRHRPGSRGSDRELRSADPAHRLG